MSDSGHGGHEKQKGGSTRREFLFGLGALFTSVFTRKNLESLVDNLNLFTSFILSPFKKGSGGSGGGGHSGDHGGHAKH